MIKLTSLILVACFYNLCHGGKEPYYKNKFGSNINLIQVSCKSFQPNNHGSDSQRQYGKCIYDQ